MPANYPAKLLAILVGIALLGSILVLVAMREPMADIRNDDPRFQTSATSTLDDGPSSSDDIACFTPSDEGTPENLAGCQFDPNTRYTYVDGAWMTVPGDYTYPDGNRPPTGAELDAVRDGTYDREVEAGS